MSVMNGVCVSRFTDTNPATPNWKCRATALRNLHHTRKRLSTGLRFVTFDMSMCPGGSEHAVLSNNCELRPSRTVAVMTEARRSCLVCIHTRRDRGKLTMTLCARSLSGRECPYITILKAVRAAREPHASRLTSSCGVPASFWCHSHKWVGITSKGSPRHRTSCFVTLYLVIFLMRNTDD